MNHFFYDKQKKILTYFFKNIKKQGGKIEIKKKVNIIKIYCRKKHVVIYSQQDI
ncbi:MAG: hypothetical protein PWQ97_505 [Tepidanaerobacteraceae bacterium]|nr:hypothetical protein [Tepidanaerobacteraceae bacterium]